MVANYHKMMVKCKTSEERLEKIYTENSRFKMVAQNLGRKIKELSGCNSKCFDIESMSLEVSRT